MPIELTRVMTRLASPAMPRMNLIMANLEQTAVCATPSIAGMRLLSIILESFLRIAMLAI
jgi:hypothetical protein